MCRGCDHIKEVIVFLQTPTITALHVGYLCAQQALEQVQLSAGDPFIFAVGLMENIKQSIMIRRSSHAASLMFFSGEG